MGNKGKLGTPSGSGKHRYAKVEHLERFVCVWSCQHIVYTIAAQARRGVH